MKPSSRLVSLARRFAGPMLLVAGLVPSLVVARQALAKGPKPPIEIEGDDEANGPGDEDEAAEATPREQLTKRRRAVLAKLTTDETVLINVTTRDMPASPDILNLGRKSAHALTRCVSDNVDDGLRRYCATLLGRIGDRAALPALQGALEAWDAGVRTAAIDALARMPDKSSVEPLIGLFHRADESAEIRTSVLRALGVIGDLRAIALLRELVHSKKADDAALRSTAFQALWRSRHLIARSVIVGDVAFALRDQDAGLQLRATYAAAELRAPELVSALTPLMQHQDTRTRNRAVYALGKIGDKAATKALVAQVARVREARMLNNIAFALERLDAQAFYGTAQGLIDHKQAAIRMNAAFVLGDVRRPEGVPMLAKAVSDTNDLVRISAVTALGKIDSPEVPKVLEKLIDTPPKPLQEAAIYALYTQSGHKRTDLVFDKLYVPAKQPGAKQQAAIALGKAADPRVTDDLLLCFEQRRCALGDVGPFFRAKPRPEVPGRLLLEWAKGRSELTDLLGALKPAGAGPLALSDMDASLAKGNPVRTAYAIDLVGDLGEAMSPPALRRLLTHESARLRLHAAVALARVGDKAGDEVLLRDLDNVAAEQLPSFARLLARVEEADAQKRLGPELEKREKGRDIGVALAAAAARLAWGPEKAIFRLLDALAASDVAERELAERYLVRAKPKTVTFLLRRALSRETREPVAARLRKILDLRAANDG